MSFRFVARNSWILFASLLVSCDEVFPPYAQPRNVLRGELSAVVPDTIEVFQSPDDGSYSMNSSFTFKVTITNLHDDLLEGTAQVGGNISVFTFGAVPRLVVVALTLGDLRRPPVFQGNIALPPGKDAEFDLYWLPIPNANNGHMLFEGESYVEKDSARVYAPISCIAYATAQLFERVQAAKAGECQFSLVFRVKQTR